MKRIGNLYDKITTMSNLILADKKARRHKAKTYGVRVFDKDRNTKLDLLQEALLTKTFKTSPYTVFTIYEPKERIIYRLPYYPDRIVHHAIMNVVEPIWTKTFTYNTFSCIKKRGIEGCAKYVDKIIASYNGKSLYCLKIDIRKYYPSINHDVMKMIVRKKIKDKDLLWLLDEIIDSADGLPIGNYISQYLANLYLAYFIHKVNERYKFDVSEYADDIVFFSTDKDKLHNLLSVIQTDIEKDLQLKIKPNFQIFPVAQNRYDKSGLALDYVGYKFYRRQKLMRKRTKQRFCRKVHQLNRRENITEKAYKQAVAPWLGWAYHSNSRNLLKKIIKPCYYDSILRPKAL